MAKKNKVCIHLTDADYEAGAYIGFWSKKQTNEYLSNMQKVRFESQCLHGITLSKKIQIDSVYCPTKNMELEIALELPSEIFMSCNEKRWFLPDPAEKHCLDNIRTGKCVDPFVIEHIGKVFFADKYTKTK